MLEKNPMPKAKQKTKNIGGSYETERTEVLGVMRTLGVDKVAKLVTAEMLSEVQTELLPKWGMVSGTTTLELETNVVDTNGTTSYLGVVTDLSKFTEDAYVTYSLKVVYQFKVLLDNTTTNEV
jgi:hypothetical protein